MFTFNHIEPCDYKTNWYPGGNLDKKSFYVSNKVARCLRREHVVGICFLYRIFKKFSGTIINCEKRMNMQLQVCAFMEAVNRSENGQLVILIVCPDYLIHKWSYHLVNHAGLKIKVISECINVKPDKKGIAYIVSHQEINKQATKFSDIDLFSVIVDKMDLISYKRVLKSLQGNFKIGLTNRNFYINPDPKIKWEMIHWAVPQFGGTLKECYKLEKKQFQTLTDYYCRWWTRLTWHFCESFKKITDQEHEKYKNQVLEWCENHNIPGAHVQSNTSRRGSKRPRTLSIVGYQLPPTFKLPTLTAEQILKLKNKRLNELMSLSLSNNIKHETEVSSRKKQKQCHIDEIIESVVNNIEFKNVKVKYQTSETKEDSLDQSNPISNVICQISETKESVNALHLGNDEIKTNIVELPVGEIKNEDSKIDLGSDNDDDIFSSIIKRSSQHLQRNDSNSPPDNDIPKRISKDECDIQKGDIFSDIIKRSQKNDSVTSTQDMRTEFHDYEEGDIFTSLIRHKSSKEIRKRGNYVSTEDELLSNSFFDDLDIQESVNIGASVEKDDEIVKLLRETELSELDKTNEVDPEIKRRILSFISD